MNPDLSDSSVYALSTALVIGVNVIMGMLTDRQPLNGPSWTLPTALMPWVILSL